MFFFLLDQNEIDKRQQFRGLNVVKLQRKVMWSLSYVTSMNNIFCF